MPVFGGSSGCGALAVTAPVLAYDTFSRTVASGWGNADIGGTWSIVSGTQALFSTNGSVGSISLDTSGTVQEAVLSKANGTIVTGSVDIGFSALPTVNNFLFVFLTQRTSLDGNQYFYRTGLYIDYTGLICVRSEGVPAITMFPDTSLPATYTVGTTLSIKSQLATVNPTLSLAKVWASSTPEPAYFFTGSDPTSIGPQVYGSTGIRAAYLDCNGLPPVSASPISVYVDNLLAVKAAVNP